MVTVVLLLAVGAKAASLSIKRVTQVMIDGDVGSSYFVQVNNDLNNEAGWKSQWYVTVTSTELIPYILDDSPEANRFYRVVNAGAPQGPVLTRMSASSPLQRLVQISSTAQTDNVLLGKFDIKSQGRAGTLRSLTLGLHVNGATISELFSNVKVVLNGNAYSADTITETPAIERNVKFSNMSEVLPADQWVTVSVYGTIKQDVNGEMSGTTAHVSLTASGVTDGSDNNPMVEDANFMPMAVTPTPLIANTVTFSSIPGVLSGLSASVGAPLIVNNETVAYPVSFTFSLAAGDDTLYIAERPSFLSGQSTRVQFMTEPLVANPGTIPGDVAGNYFVVPAGSSRAFVLHGTIRKGESSGNERVEIDGIPFGTDSSNLNKYNITYGLQALGVEVSFAPGTVSGGNSSSNGPVSSGGTGSSGSGF